MAGRQSRAILLIPYLVLLATLTLLHSPGKPDHAVPVFVGLALLLLGTHTVVGFLVGAALPVL
jgi:hypothetical protein